MMKRAWLLVLLAGCGQEPPPPAPPVFSSTSLAEPRALDLAPEGTLPDPARENVEIPFAPPPPLRRFPPDPAWERLNRRHVSHVEAVDPWVRNPAFTINHASVLEVLAQLARLQEEDGSWSPLPACPQCGPGADMDRVGATALAVLAFLRAGIHTRQDYFREGKSLDLSLRRGLEWILSDQDVASTTGRRSLRHRAMAAAVLAEAGSHTYSLHLRGEAARSIDLLLATPLGDPDLATLAWTAQAAQAAWWSYPPRPGQDWIVRLQAELEARPPTEDPTDAARSAAFRILIERNKGNRLISQSMDILMRNKPAGKQPDLVYWREGTWAVSLYDGPSGPRWKAWSEALGPVLEEARRNLKCSQAAALAGLMLLDLHRPAYPRRGGYRSA